jgi:hypothetical protein
MKKVGFSPSCTRQVCTPSALILLLASTYEFRTQVTDPSSLGFSCGFLYKVIKDEASVFDTALSQPFGGSAHYVDVRDLAQAHVNALVKEEAGNQRLIVSAGVWTWQDFGEC